MSDQPTGNPDPNQQPPAQVPPPPQVPLPDPGMTQPMGYPQGYPPPHGYPPGYGPPPPGYPQGYPQGYPAPQMGYPPGYAPPPGYPQGYPHPQGYPAPQMGYPPGYAPPPPGYPQGYPPQQPGMMPPPAGVPAPSASHIPALSGSPSPSLPSPNIPAPAGMPTPALPLPNTPSLVPTAESTSVPVMAASAIEVGEADEVLSAVDPVHGEFFHPPALTHIESGPPPNPMVQMWRKIGGGSLTLSLLIHAGIIVVGGLIVVSTQVFQKQVDFLPGGGTQQGQKASADRQHKVAQKKRTSLNKSTAMKKIVSKSESAAISLPDAPPDLLDVPDVSSNLGGAGGLGGGGFGRAGSGGGFGTGMGMGSAAGFVSLPPSMRSRCSTQERLEKLRQNGGNPECERAVSQSLEWLKSKQNEDGSWGKSNKAAMTGLALLCYLGRCETPESPFYGDNVMKGILYLIEVSKKNPHGIISDSWQAGKGGGGSYEHGIATYALGEMYTLARLGSKSLPGMREAFEKGVKVVIDNQNKAGSWTYGGDVIVYNKDSAGEDLSVTGWQYQALKAAKNSGLKIPGLHSAIDKCCDYIVTKQTKDGGYGLPDRDKHYNQWSLTGTGTLGLQTLSKTKTASVKKSIKFLRDFITAEPLDWNKNCNLYCWYYYTQAFFQAGGDDWKFYNEQFLPQILAAQQPDGAFKAGRANWPAGDAADPIYRQTLCTLQLEVYYRYLKVADRDEESFFDK